MSRFSDFIHKQYGTTVGGSVTSIVAGLAGPALGQVKDLATEAVAMIEMTGLAGSVKKQIVTMVVNYALAALHITLPTSVVSWIIEEAVLLLKGGKSEPTAPVAPSPVPPPVIVPPPPPPPPAGPPYYEAFDAPVPDDTDLKAKGFVAGDTVEVNSDQSRWRVVNLSIGGAGWTTLRVIA